MQVPPRRTRTSVGWRRGITWLACLSAAGLLVAHVAEAAVARESPQARIDRGLLVLRIGLALAGAAVVAWGAFARRGPEGAAAPARTLRRALLLVLAGAAFGANYNLFVWTGLHRHELYHYYLGSKYFPELGYTGLYVCSAQAAAEAGFDVAALEEMTDLASKERRTASALLAAAAPCREAFSPARWDSFGADVAAFRAWMGDGVWSGVLRDHGYNPSPAWTLFGRSIASLVPATPAGLWWIAKLDVLLLLVAFAAVAAAFGLEAACVAVIAWGSCGHTRYQWTGDAFLRQLWLAISLGGLAALRVGRPATGGALLAVATLERVFPGAFFLGFGARELATWIRERRVSPELWRFAGGALAATVAVVVLATLVAGRGVAAWREFGDNTRSMLSFTPRNALGLDYALSFTTVPPPGGLGSNPVEREEIVQAYRRTTLASRAPLRVAGLAAFGALFACAAWRGAGRRQGGSQRLAAWEATALGAAAIPFLTMPGSYYVGFVVVGALLATRRWRCGLALLLACAAWSASLVAYGERAIAFASSSWILLAYSLWLLAEAAFAEPAPDDERLSRR